MNIVIHGCGGRMGRILTEMIFEENEHKVLCGIDIECIGDLSYPIYRDFTFVTKKVDVVIDFSNPTQ